MLNQKIIAIYLRTVANICLTRTYTNLRHVPHINPHHFRQSIRKHSGANANSMNYEQDKGFTIATMEEHKMKHGPGSKYTVLRLQELFHISAEQAKAVLKSCPQLKRISLDSIDCNFKLYESAAVDRTVLLQYPVLLCLSDTEAKIQCLQRLSIDISLIAPLLIADLDELKRIVAEARKEEDSVPYQNRIVYLSNLLNLPAPLIAEKLATHSYILRMPLDRLEDIIRVFLKYGVDPNNIMKDCWSLRYRAQSAELRLQRAANANVTRVKTWMIRCPEKIFERCINRQLENRKILGAHSSVEEYLSKRLECSIENASYLTDKYPAIMKMNILKMKEMLDFIYEQGYTPGHVCRVPRILIHSLETTKTRLLQLKELGYTPPSIALLCKSKRDFDKLLKKYAKRKKTSDKQRASTTDT